MRFARSCVLVLGAFAALALTAAPAAAQHPCDLTVVQNPSIAAATVKIGVCHDGKDVNLQPVTIIAFQIKVDNVERFNGPLAAVGAPNAGGLSYYEAPPITVTKGTHTVVAVAIGTSGPGLPSSPFGFGIVEGLPSAPQKTRIAGS